MALGEPMLSTYAYSQRRDTWGLYFFLERESVLIMCDYLEESGAEPIWPHNAITPDYLKPTETPLEFLRRWMATTKRPSPPGIKRQGWTRQWHRVGPNQYEVRGEND